MKKQHAQRSKPPKRRPRKRDAEAHSRRLMQLLPVHECKVAKGMFENGIGSAIISRTLPDGSLMVSTFLIDVFCLGIKDAMIMQMSRSEYNDLLRMTSMGDPQKDSAPCCLKKLITEAVAYAKSVGIAPHKSYEVAAVMLEGIDAAECKSSYTFGSNGKPFYISGPNDTSARTRTIRNALHTHCGEGNYDILIASEESKEEDHPLGLLSIDNPVEVENLMRAMADGLPFQTQIHPDVFQRMCSQYAWLRKASSTVQVVDISYGGDGGGIICELAFDKHVGKHVMHASLTHLMPDKRLPFYKAIYAYQKRRVAKLEKMGEFSALRFLDA